MSTVFRLLLLAGLLVCAVATALVKKPLRAVIIYMAYSIIMSVIWILLEAPDLKKGRLGAANAYLVDTRALLAAALSAMRAEPYRFVTDISSYI